MRRIIGLFTAALLMVAMMAIPASAQQRDPSGADGTYNCSDFADQPDAQAYFDEAGDIDGLDADGDGIPCEGLPGGPTEGTTPTGADPGTPEADPEEEGDDESDDESDDEEEPTDDGEETAAPSAVDSGTGGLAGGMPLGVVLAMLLGFAMLTGGVIAAVRK